MASENTVSDGVVIIDADFRPIGLDAGAEAIFDRLVAHGNGDVGMPKEILELLQSRAAKDSNGAPMYVSAGGRHYTCRVFVVRPRGGAEPLLTLYLRREVSIIDAAHQIAVEYGLTDREEEALSGLALGLSSKELATRMNISPNTVKAFVRLAMIKMGARSRACVFAKLLDRQAGA
jgi:DNA-binding CsgD family transcriptional regulator